MKKVIDAIFAAILGLLLFAGHVRGATPNAFDMKDGCTTPSQIEKQIGWRPAYHIWGNELVEFHKHYEQKFKVSPPTDVDEVLIWNKKGSENILFIAAKNGCITHSFMATLDEFLELYEGEGL